MPQAVADETPTTQSAVATACPRPAKRAVYRAPGRGRTVALTFDDGASPTTLQILAILEQYGVHATFFDTGEFDTKYPEVAAAIVAGGNTLGNHTYHHFRDWGLSGHLSRAVQRRELTATSVVQARVIGHAPCVMRPVGGAFDSAALRLARSQGMSLVEWSVDTLDWQQPPTVTRVATRRIISRAVSGARLQHPIILFHAGKASHERDCSRSGCRRGQVASFRGNTVAALPAIIRFYRDRGYRFVTL